MKRTFYIKEDYSRELKGNLTCCLIIIIIIASVFA